MSRTISISSHRRAFTLIELLVVIGIIAVLMALSMAAILRAHKQAVRTRMQADLGAIGTALESYKHDFGDYPRFDDDNSNGGLNLRTDRGAVLLCHTLIAPGPKVDQSGGTSKFGWDGADGPGFRTRPGIGGNVYGPYIPSDKFQIGGTDHVDFTDAVINDSNGNPVLYYPGTPGTPAITATNGFVASFGPAGYGQVVSRPLYNAFDNTANPNTMATYLSVADMQAILGADPTTGAVAATRTAAYTGPYILWTAGADGIYGRDANGKTDDVTNFDIPLDVRR